VNLSAQPGKRLRAQSAMRGMLVDEGGFRADFAVASERGRIQPLAHLCRHSSTAYLALACLQSAL
jgi:hypothetical protein